MAVLREVKYLNFQQQKEIPRSAETLFSQYETFRKFVGNLELIVGWYNEVSPWAHAAATPCCPEPGFPRMRMRCPPLWPARLVPLPLPTVSPRGLPENARRHWWAGGVGAVGSANAGGVALKGTLSVPDAPGAPF